MKHSGSIGLFLAAFGILFAQSANARGFTNLYQEDNDMIANGQGVSSPSFWDGLSGANPAGLIRNVDLKLQGTAATFDDSTRNLRESGGILAGNGMFGGGVEYSNYDSGPYPSGVHRFNVGGAINLEPVRTTLGVTGHFVSDGGGSSYDLGALIDLFPRLRLGGVIPNVGNGFQILGAGLTYFADPMVDFVVDAGYQFRYQQGVVKPGISLHTNILHATASYGVRYAGTWDSVFVTTKFSAALGIALGEHILAEYEYRGLTEHRLGLTLRFN